MSKVVYFILLGGLLIATIAAINVSSVHEDERAKFIPISVLSKKQANYGVDTNLVTVPAVSVDILEDKVRDTQGESSIQIIRYTSLPLESQEETGQDSDNTQSVHPGGSHNNQENNGNGNSNQNMNNNGNGNAGGGNNSSNKGKEKEKEKETKPDKSNAPQDKATAPENKGPAAEAAPDKIK